jgi:hypothetical protein
VDTNFFVTFHSMTCRLWIFLEAAAGSRDGYQDDEEPPPSGPPATHFIVVLKRAQHQERSSSMRPAES